MLKLPSLKFFETVIEHAPCWCYKIYFENYTFSWKRRSVTRIILHNNTRCLRHTQTQIFFFLFIFDTNRTRFSSNCPHISESRALKFVKKMRKLVYTVFCVEDFTLWTEQNQQFFLRGTTCSLFTFCESGEKGFCR